MPSARVHRVVHSLTHLIVGIDCLVQIQLYGTSVDNRNANVEDEPSGSSGVFAQKDVETIGQGVRQSQIAKRLV